MKRKRFSEEQIIGILKESEAGQENREICRKHGITEQTFLPVALEVWRDERIGGATAEGSGGGEPEAEAAAGRGASGQCGAEGAVTKKLVRPAQRKQAVGYLVAEGLRSQRRACILVGISRTVMAYQCRGHGDEALRIRLEALASQYPRYGYLLLHGMLKREGL